MKKIIAAVTSLLLTLATSNVMLTSYAHDYEYHYFEYSDKDNYYSHDEYKIGTLSDEKSRFSGCDLYTYETTEAYEGVKPLETTYDYIAVPNNVIGNWFENRKSSDNRFKEKYDVMLPLHTGYILNYSTLELEDSHCYDMRVLWKKVPYIKIVSDTDTSLGFDMYKANEFLPQVKKQEVGKDENGNFVYYLSTDFNKLESNAETILTKEDASRLLELKNEHLISVNYCEEYELQNIPFSEYPVYNENDIEKASECFEKYGINFSVRENSYNEQMIVPDEKITALEFYELISKVQEDTGAMPEMVMNEVYSTKLITKEIYNSVKGDANSDGQFNIADIVTLKNFLLGEGTTGINADLNDDNIIDTFDMILMRQHFLETFLK